MILIKLKKKTEKKTYYTLVLDGFMCEKHLLAKKPTHERDVLDKMGRLICRRNALNFFGSDSVYRKIFNSIIYVQTQSISPHETSFAMSKRALLRVE